jgi:hypothetical protein
MNANGESLEAALERTETDLEAAARQAAALTRELKKALKGAHGGVVRDLERALQGADELAGALREAVQAARGGWRFDVRAHLESGAYTVELLERARSQDLPLQQQDDRLMCFPSLLRVLAADAALDVDRKRERAIRPSAVVEWLRRMRENPVKFRPAQFLEALYQVYLLVLAEEGRRERGGTVKVLDLYRVLTVMPGSAASYPRAEFARDLYLLEEGREWTTRDGLELRFAAATGTKGSQTLTTVARDGRVKVYYAVEFIR